NFAVGDGVHRTAARQREICQSRPSLQIPEEVKERLLIHRLGRASDVIMAVFEPVARRPGRAPRIVSRWCETQAEFGGPIHPLIRDVLPMMAEEFKVELEPAVWDQAHNFPHGVET